MTKTYDKTVQAFLAEEGSKWGIVDALVAEMPGHTSASDLGECRGYLAQHGVELEVGTIKRYRVVGRYLEESAPSQRAAFRAQSVTVIQEFALFGLSQEAALDFIRRYQKDTGKKAVTRRAARSFVNPQGSQATLAANPEDWTPEQWAAFDAQVIDASKTLLLAFNTLQRGLYSPSVEAIAQLGLIKPADLDAELAAFLNQA